MGNRATFVLVHGAFQGGWVWEETAAALRAVGHEVHVPALAGCGHLHHGLRQGVTLYDHVTDVLDYLRLYDVRDGVLVAHSLSGMTCGAVLARAAGTPQALRQAVYVDAILPERGRSFVDTAGPGLRAMLDAHLTDGWRVRQWPLPAFGVPEARAAWFAERLRDFPAAVFEAVFEDDFTHNPAMMSFIACRATPAPFIRAMADKARALGWPVDELDSGHMPMVNRPAELAALLDAHARRGCMAG